MARLGSSYFGQGPSSCVVVISSSHVPCRQLSDSEAMQPF